MLVMLVAGYAIWVMLAALVTPAPLIMLVRLVLGVTGVTDVAGVGVTGIKSVWPV